MLFHTHLKALSETIHTHTHHQKKRPRRTEKWLRDKVSPPPPRMPAEKLPPSLRPKRKSISKDQNLR